MTNECSGCGKSLMNDIYGSRCEDCWSVGAQASSERGQISLYERHAMNRIQLSERRLGDWYRRGRVVRK